MVGQKVGYENKEEFMCTLISDKHLEYFSIFEKTTTLNGKQSFVFSEIR